MGYELMVGHEIGEQREDLQSSLVRLSVGIRVKGQVRKRKGMEKPRMHPAACNKRARVVQSRRDYTPKGN